MLTPARHSLGGIYLFMLVEPLMVVHASVQIVLMFVGGGWRQHGGAGGQQCFVAQGVHFLQPCRSTCCMWLDHVIMCHSVTGQWNEGGASCIGCAWRVVSVTAQSWLAVRLQRLCMRWWFVFIGWLHA